MVNKILFWSGFGTQLLPYYGRGPHTVESITNMNSTAGLLTRFWQLGIEMRPFHQQWWAYGIYGGVGAGFGYWLQGVEQNQMRYLKETRDRLLEKRKRRQEREGAEALQAGTDFQKNQEGLLASPTTVVHDSIAHPAGMVERTEAAQ
jgi:hypothetical protein